MFSDPLFLFATVACIVVLGILLFGIGTFAKGGEFSQQDHAVAAGGTVHRGGPDRGLRLAAEPVMKAGG